MILNRLEDYRDSLRVVSPRTDSWRVCGTGESSHG